MFSKGKTEPQQCHLSAVSEDHIPIVTAIYTCFLYNWLFKCTYIDHYSWDIFSYRIRCLSRDPLSTVLRVRVQVARCDGKASRPVSATRVMQGQPLQIFAGHWCHSVASDGKCKNAVLRSIEHFGTKARTHHVWKESGDDLSNWPQEMGLRWSTYFLQPTFKSMHLHIVGTNIWAVSWHLPWCYFMGLWLASTSTYLSTSVQIMTTTNLRTRSLNMLQHQSQSFCSEAVATGVGSKSSQLLCRGLLSAGDG